MCGPGRLFAATAVAATLAALGTAPAPAAEHERTERVSVAADGFQGNDTSLDPSISADGRFVAFHSTAPNLVPGDTNRQTDVFVRDREGATERVSVAGDGSQADRDSRAAAISADGRYVAFHSRATNLVAGVTNDVQDVYVHDRHTGDTERVSVAGDGAEADSVSWNASISGDGRYVAFESFATNLVPDDTNGRIDVFVRDRVAGTTERVSVASEGREGNGDSRLPAISADGRYVSFQSRAWDLGPGANLDWDVYVHDRATGVTEQVSVASDGGPGNGQSARSDISADGRYVVFESEATNLVPSDTNLDWDVFVRDRQLGRTERVSVASDGLEGDDFSWDPAISGDGRYVAFMSRVDHTAEQAWQAAELYLHDRATRSTERVSVAWDGGEADGNAYAPSVNGDGQAVAFNSIAGNLVPDDTNNRTDVFVRDFGDRTADVSITALAAEAVEARVTVSGQVAVAGTVLTAASAEAAPHARPLGAELSQVTLVARPAHDDLLARLAVTEMPGLRVQGVPGSIPCNSVLGCVPSVGGVPAVTYTFAFTVAGVPHEARAYWLHEATAGTTAPRFTLYRCEDGCEPVQALAGGHGTTGEEILLAIPRTALPGGDLEAITASTAAGAADTGPVARLHDVVVPDPGPAAVTVTVGIEELAQAPAEIDDDGMFKATLDADDLPAGRYTVTARACLADACAEANVPVDVPLRIALLDLVLVRDRGRTIATAALTDPDGDGLGGRTIQFAADGHAATATTDASGVARVEIPPPHGRPGAAVEARFPGDAFYAPVAASATVPGGQR